MTRVLTVAVDVPQPVVLEREGRRVELQIVSLRHRLFDIPVIIRQGIQYAAARGALLSLVPLAAVALLMDLLWHGSEPLIGILQSRGWIYGG